KDREAAGHHAEQILPICGSLPILAHRNIRYVLRQLHLKLDAGDRGGSVILVTTDRRRDLRRWWRPSLSSALTRRGMECSWRWGSPGDITAETSGEGVEQGLSPVRPGLPQTRARTSQFAAGKNTPRDLVYF